MTPPVALRVRVPRDPGVSSYYVGTYGSGLGQVLLISLLGPSRLDLLWASCSSYELPINIRESRTQKKDWHRSPLRNYVVAL